MVAMTTVSRATHFSANLRDLLTGDITASVSISSQRERERERERRGGRRGREGGN